jgi:hypothetical protein
MSAIGEAYPGDWCVVAPEGSYPGERILKAKVIEVFNWLVRETKGFELGAEVEFYHGAAGIGHCLHKILNGRTFSTALDLINESSVPVPMFSVGYSNGPEQPYLFISDLRREKGTFGEGKESRDSVQKIIIIGDQPMKPRERMVFLKDILSP